MTTIAEVTSWIDPDGGVLPLDGSSYYKVLWGRQGFWGPSVDIVRQTVTRDSPRTKYVQRKEKQLRLPILIEAPDEATLLAARDALDWAMDPERGPGKLRNSGAGAGGRQTREFIARLKDWSSSEDSGSRVAGAIICGLTLESDDGFWYDAEATVANFALSGAIVHILDAPVIPWKIAPSGIADAFSVENTGSVECWPVWTIHGPGSAITFTNLTTGKSLYLNIELAADDILTIDTSPLAKTITLQDGSSQYQALTDSTRAALWPLVTGTNNLSLSMSSVTIGSLLTLSYKQRYRSA